MDGKTSQEAPEIGDDSTVPERRLYPVNDVAVIIGISPRSTWDLVYSGKLATKWIGHRRLVPAEVLDEYIASLPSEKPDLEASAA
jgi:hypothetical protein